MFIGFDVGRHKQAFGIEFSENIIDLPISEETIVGIGIGISRSGREVIVDLMFEGFLARCLEPLTNGVFNHICHYSYDSGPIVIRAMSGPFYGTGAAHSGQMPALVSQLRDIHLVYPLDLEMLEGAFSRAISEKRPLVVLELTDDLAAMADVLGRQFVSLSLGTRLVKANSHARRLFIVSAPYAGLTLDVLSKIGRYDDDLLAIGILNSASDFPERLLEEYEEILLINTSLLESRYIGNWVNVNMKFQISASNFASWTGDTAISPAREDITRGISNFISQFLDR